MSEKTYLKNRSIWFELLSQAVALGGALLAAKFCMQYLDPYKEQKEQAKRRAAFLRRHLGRNNLELNEFEQLLAASVMNPETIDVEISDVKGLDKILEEIELKVLLPLREPEMFNTTLLRQAKGVLLYGPPGTGKTMIAKAIARQSHCYFLNVTVSSLLSKWLGDANRLVKAVFSLAEKLQPCIIFIDEVDALLGKRGSSSEHEATLQLKTEFMQLWDGMESVRGQRVVVLGATNRPHMVDEAVLRRFTLQFHVGLPGPEERRAILQGYLRRHHDDMGTTSRPAVDPALLPDKGQAKLAAYRPKSADVICGLTQIASLTEGFSGSDLLELCMQAAQRPASEMYLQKKELQRRGEDGEVPWRPVSLQDFEEVLKTMRPATHKAEEYRKTLSEPSTLSDVLSMFAASAMRPEKSDSENGNSEGEKRV